MFKLNTAEQFESFIFAAVPWHHNENRLPEQQQQSGVVKLHCSNIYHLCFAIQWHCNNIATLHTHYTSVMPRLPSNDHPLPSGLRCPAQPSPSSSHLIFQSPNVPVLTNDPSSCQALGRISKQPPAGRVSGRWRCLSWQMCRVPLLRECGMQILRQHGAGTIIVWVSLTFTIGFCF